MTRGRRVGALGLAIAGAASLLLASPQASAYCRTSSCPGGITGAVCVPARGTDCGVPVHWPSPCVGFSLHKDASKLVDLGTTQAIFEQAFATWMNADCGGASPRIRVTYAGAVDCGDHEYNQDAGNANAIVYREDTWPHPGGTTTLALTTVTYNLDNGEIYDADMELNSSAAEFSVGDDDVTYDLLSIVTHETGHFLGLSHTDVVGATMLPDYLPGSTSLRDLHADDVAGICAIYPPGDIGSCDPTPRHGYSPLCASEQPVVVESGCCSAAPGAPGDRDLGAFAAALALSVVVARRRARA